LPDKFSEYVHVNETTSIFCMYVPKKIRLHDMWCVTMSVSVSVRIFHVNIVHG